MSDLKLFMNVTSDPDIVSLQNDLSAVNDQSTQNRLCKYMTFSHCAMNNSSDYFIEEESLERASVVEVFWGVV